MAFAAVFLLSPLSVLAQQNTAKPADIDRNGVLILIRSTLLALDHANKTGNYSVLRALGSPGFQKLTVERLAEIFAKQRNEIRAPATDASDRSSTWPVRVAVD